MKHPLIKLFLARLRALAAVGRAAFPVLALPAFVTPFSHLMLRLERADGETFMIVAAGDSVDALFGRPLVGTPFVLLFEPEDRPRVARMLSATACDRIACVFSAEARHSRFRATVIEAMLAPEPGEGAQPTRAGACVASFGFPRGYGERALPLLTLRSKRFVDLDGLSAGTAPGRAARRWPAA